MMDGTPQVRTPTRTEREMSSRGRKLAKTEKEARRRQRDAQELDKLVKATAATFRSSYETGEDCAAECEHRRADLLADLDYRRLPYEIWRGRPGAEVLVSAMADLIAENERHLAAIEQLCRRLDDLSKNGTWHETLSPEVVPDELIRRRLFSDPPA
jgi:hypothetical protein